MTVLAGQQGFLCELHDCLRYGEDGNGEHHIFNYPIGDGYIHAAVWTLLYQELFF